MHNNYIKRIFFPNVFFNSYVLKKFHFLSEYTLATTYLGYYEVFHCLKVVIPPYVHVHVTI